MTTSERSTNVLVGELARQVIGDGMVVLPGQGDSLAIETDAEVVILDGSGYLHVEAMITTLREHTASLQLLVEGAYPVPDLIYL